MGDTFKNGDIIKVCRFEMIYRYLIIIDKRNFRKMGII